jgi:sialic acid synthase SpsE/quercetin dioxygenase-like cupin family protein
MMKEPEKLFILEMANNHMGDLDHGIKLIKTFSVLCKKYPMFKFAFKLQYRDLETFIHPNFKNRLDIKYIKRFLDTSLSKFQFNQLIDEIRANNFLAVATCFDESSFNLLEEQNLDIIKIASCSLTDWPLLERAALNNKPIIASTAGAKIEDIDRVVFFLRNREKDFSLMHCVGEYPTPDENAHLSQIDFLKKRYENIPIGYSTHESPDNVDLIKIAVAKGATIFEKHVGLNTYKYPINSYSVNLEQADKWLAAALYSLKVCGEKKNRLPENILEKKSLAELRRGIFAKRFIKSGDLITKDNVYFAFPPNSDQYTANNFSKYSKFLAITDIETHEPVGTKNAEIKNIRDKYINIANKVQNFLSEAKITVPGGSGLEISHHYGIELFEKFGLVMITVVNREYCKKILVILPGQKHPEQYHEKKEETFHILYGELNLELNGKIKILSVGELITILPGVRHSFESKNGAVVEEISTKHSKDDSHYTDSSISKNLNRKTFLNYWMNID